MNRFFAILIFSLTVAGSYANHLVNTPAPNADIEIYPSVVSSELNINVDENLANGAVTVSIFNSVGEIVLEETLGLGLNKLDVTKLAKGNYIAVVRANDAYKSKSSFDVV